VRQSDWIGVASLAYLFVALGFYVGFGESLERDAKIEPAGNIWLAFLVGMVWPIALLVRCGYRVGHYAPEKQRPTP
jgi:hypothetical protein